ncbi:patatin-like phospholipase family protein [Marinifilum flexuosum]|uniref:patatin-like phospholipase family protein n=1 Tax=Marinifilum flexuosum TaxID=1117708 RepID=UPI00248F8FA4|nr:patatin-like phospholipase family protein [Marinifilum flexuosum]
MSEKFKILSIDGGGLKGVVPLQVIKEIEKLTKQPIHKTFDLIAGTSTGGLLTCALLLEDDKSIEGNKRKYSLEQIQELYIEKGKDIFPKYKYFSWILMHTRKWIRPMYFTKSFDKILKDYFSDYRITSCLKPIYISSYDIHRNIPLIFTTRNATAIDEKNSRLVDICRATSAAPTYFPTYTFNYNKENVVCIDGGMIMNNPSLGALIEVLGNSSYKHYKKNNKPLELSDIAILSLGTGISSKQYSSKYSKRWGLLRWIKKVVNITLSAPVNLVSDQLETLYKSNNIEKNYLRLNVEIDEKYAEMDDSRESTLNYLLDVTNSKITNNHTLKDRLKIFLTESGVNIDEKNCC